jgi:hypothetical protein
MPALGPPPMSSCQRFIGRADFFLASLQSFLVLLPKAGVATPEEVQAFVGKQLRASEDGTLFAGYNFYAMIAERPLQTFVSSHPA